MMGSAFDTLPDAAARRRALLDHDSTLLVEAGAGSGKTALMAGRIALLLASGVPAREIVAITFIEAASSELLERIERYLPLLAQGLVPDELRLALPEGLSAEQAKAIAVAADSIDEITCTTIHGFCQQLVKPYPVETWIDPGAAIIDPAAADLAYQDLVQAWLSARFGRDRGAEGLGRLPPLPKLDTDDFFVELLQEEPDGLVKLFQEAAAFLRTKRTAAQPPAAIDPGVLEALSLAVRDFATWYAECGLTEEATQRIIADLERIRELADDALTAPISGRRLAQLFLHEIPCCQHGSEPRFSAWRNKGKWQDAAKDAGLGKPRGTQLSDAAQVHYARCDAAYQAFAAGVCGAAFARFVAEFDSLAKLYADYKRQAALLDFDDLLHHARDLLLGNEAVRQDLSRRYARILVDEFQDTDPLQAEILWRLCGDGAPDSPWFERRLRPGSLFLVGDPKQAIYRFRGADVDTYIEAKHALLAQDPHSVIAITANFRSLKPILDFANAQFCGLLSEEQGQPGLIALQSTRPPQDGRAAVACFDIAIDERHRNAQGKLAVDLVRREEASIIAELLERLIGAYPVWDKHIKAIRPCRAGDVALLAPTGTSLWIYERSLERRGIPIASQAGKSFFRRQEVQDLIALARAIADRRDTLGLGALLRGPLVGLTEEQIADAIAALPSTPDGAPPRLHLWTDCAAVNDPILGRALEVLQSLARRARHTTAYQLMAEAVEELNVRPILRARYQRGAERALANVELFLEMARAYDARGLTAFVEALRANWDNSEKQIEGRPDSDAEAVSIITIHSAKGLEWPIVIPVNSPTELDENLAFLHRRSDDTVHFKLLGRAPPDYELVKQEERNQLRRERVRLWYVALTRACDLLLLPRQSERSPSDWFGLLGARLDELPAFDAAALSRGRAPKKTQEPENPQDEASWRTEAAAIAAARRSIIWRSPSRHEGLEGEQPVRLDEDIFTDAAALEAIFPVESGPALLREIIQGGRERGLVLHKLLEEVLTGETAEEPAALKTRARILLAELAVVEAENPETGPHAPEIAATALRALTIPAVAALRPRLLPEMTVFSAEICANAMTYIGGIVDALVLGEDGAIDVVIDWKSDVDPSLSQVELYRAQVRDYLAATGAKEGLLVFATSGRIELLRRPGSC
jgi:exodeoxyribonuclease-5